MDPRESQSGPKVNSEGEHEFCGGRSMYSWIRSTEVIDISTSIKGQHQANDHQNAYGSTGLRDVPNPPS